MADILQEVGDFDSAYAEALNESVTKPGRLPTILLGNGFSIACSDAFQYTSLLDLVPWESIGEALGERPGAEDMGDWLTTQVGSTDLELCVTWLDQRGEHYAAHLLRIALANSLIGLHPTELRNSDVGGLRLESASRFLTKFDQIFTLNYDLLLNSVMTNLRFAKSGRDGVPQATSFRDGFSPRHGRHGPLVWRSSGRSNVHYLHGALHLFSGQESVPGGPPRPILEKLRWLGGTDSYLEQTRELLNSGRSPLLVTEGLSREKLAKIHRYPYLKNALEQLQVDEGPFFLFGLSLTDNDKHILDAATFHATGASAPRLYVGVYGDVEDSGNQALRTTLAELPADIEVRLFDSASANVWGAGCM